MCIARSQRDSGTAAKLLLIEFRAWLLAMNECPSLCRPGDGFLRIALGRGRKTAGHQRPSCFSELTLAIVLPKGFRPRIGNAAERRRGLSC